jgi:hypothetical protein
MPVTKKKKKQKQGRPRGPHKLGCRCFVCTRRRAKEDGQSGSQSSSPSPSPQSSPGTIGPSSEGAAAEFAAASAVVIAEGGAAMAGEPEAAPDPQLLQLPYGMEIDIRQQTIKEHWLPVISNVLIARFHDEEMGFAEWETEIWAPAITGLANRYLPELLKATDRPEWAMFGVAVLSYSAVRLDKLAPLLKHVPVLGKFLVPTSARVTATPESPELRASLAPPEPAKPTAPSDSFQVASVPSGSTQ